VKIGKNLGNVEVAAFLAAHPSLGGAELVFDHHVSGRTAPQDRPQAAGFQDIDS
jgi:hypothetical protein